METTTTTTEIETLEAAWPARWLAAALRGLKFYAYIAWRGVVEFRHSDNLTFAASIAYYSLLSMGPFLLIVLYMLDQITVASTEGTLLEIVIQALPGRFEFLIGQINDLEQIVVRTGIAGALLMIWASMGVFGAITSAINHAWGVQKKPSFLHHKLIAFTMLMAAGVLMMIALLLVSIVQVAQASWFADVIDDAPFLAQMRTVLFQLAPTPIYISIVGLIYYYAPNARVRLRDVWFGAVLAGVLWRLAFAAFSWYISDWSRFRVHGPAVAVVVFLLWVYLSAVILLYGAEVSAAYARLRPRLPDEIEAEAAALEQSDTDAAPSEDGDSE
jgi:membrane protein